MTINLRVRLIILGALLFISLGILITVRIIANNNIKKEQTNVITDNNAVIEKNINNIFIEAISINNAILQIGDFYNVLLSNNYTFQEKNQLFLEKMDVVGFPSFFASYRIFYKDQIFYYKEDSQTIRNPNPIAVNELLENPSQSLMPLHLEKSLDNVNYLILGKKILDPLNENVSGFSFIYVNINYLMLDEYQDNYYIVSHYNEIIYAQNHDLIGTNINTTYLENGINSNFKSIKLNGVDYLSFNKTLKTVLNYEERYELILIGVYLYNDIFKSVIVLNWLILGAAILTFIISGGLAILLSKRLTKALNNLIYNLRSFKKTPSSDLKVTKYQKNEIGELEKTYDEMISSIIELIDKNNREQEIKRKLELDALQMQINPHFLYNTLDAIAWMAKIKKEVNIEKLVIALARFFRLSLHKGDKFIRVEEELELVKHFLEIELIRFPDKFRYQINLDESIKNISVLKLLLQPFVENAIKHGISHIKEGGIITVNAYPLNDDLVFEVIDNGIGFDQKNDDHNELTGFGIKNVQKRINLEYGLEYGVEISKLASGGTIVLIKVAQKALSLS